jgi:BirA family biotin operon repressor/biotin-[acetyl-CoA-carboxylase] ligase
MIDIDTRGLVSRLGVIESVAVIPRVTSTNLVARRIVNECIENELSLPHAIIVAGEQFAGKGRNERQWSSPPGKGIYATTLISRPASELAVLPLAMATIVAGYLHETYGIDARIKWPNDIIAAGKKIAGILIEARIQDDRAFLIIGTGVNVEPVADDSRPAAIAISELARNFTGIGDATVAFIEHVDARFSKPIDRERVLSEWRSLSVHKPGDRIQCVLNTRTVSGTWVGIDDDGRAVLNTIDGPIHVSAGDIIMV